MDADCGCHCIKCKGTNLKTDSVGEPEEDGYYDMHHTCADCNAHFDHLEGVTFPECQACGFPGDGVQRGGR
ncbi:MAG: hypothetical protein J4F28_05905 [Nitrosopumilaceae archaeon]|nr:hypothetical protein [Nitrosopumilaceae archaeon]